MVVEQATLMKSVLKPGYEFDQLLILGMLVSYFPYQYFSIFYIFLLFSFNISISYFRLWFVFSERISFMWMSGLYVLS